MRLRQGRHASRWPATRPSSPRPGTRSPRARLGLRRDDLRCWTPTEARTGSAPPRVLGGTLHAALRRRAPGPAGARPGRAPSSAGACAIHERTAVTRDRARRRAHDRGDGPRPTSWCGRPRATPPQLPGCARDVVPVYSLMVATEPLPEPVWDADRAARAARRSPTSGTCIIYGQRTADGRLAFGGRGAPYHFGSTDPAGVRPRAARVRRCCARILAELFPALAGARVHPRLGRHRSASPRDWYPSVGFDPAPGIGWAGGYVGDGVAHDQPRRPHAAPTSIRAATTDAHAPAVGRPPLPPVGAGAAALARRQRGLRVLFTVADRAEARTGRPSRAAPLFWRALGH